MHVLIFMMNSLNRSRCSQINMIKLLADLRSNSMSSEKNIQTDKTTTKNISSPFRWRKYFFLIPLFSILLLQACKEPDAIGLDVLPDADELHLEYSDSATILSKTVREDSLRTDEISSHLLGSIWDPVFGKHEASVYAQLALEGVPSFGIYNQADSLVLSLIYTGFYGDTTYPQNISVYRITENMYYDSAYYSNRTFTYDSNPLGMASIAPMPLTPVVVGSDTVTARMRINLNVTLADSIMALNGQSQLSTNALWIDYFKGIYIKSDPVSSGIQGNMSYLNFVGSKMILYYHDTANVVKTYSFSLASTRMSHFDHDYTGSDVQQQLNDSNAIDTLSYVQAMAGVKTKISFPFLKHFLDSGSIVLNKAELELTPEPGTITNYTPPAQLFILAIREDGTSYFPADYFELSGYYGGSYNATTNKYKFNMGRQLQRILDGRDENHGFYIVPSGSSIQANRVILGRQEKIGDQTYKLKLNLYYTKLPR